MVPQCSHSQASAAGSSGPRRRIFSGTGSSACRSNGQARLWPIRASARSWRRATASRSWSARIRAPARLRLRCCGGGGRRQPEKRVLGDARRVELPGDDPGAGRRGLERGERRRGSGDREPVVQPVGMRQAQRRAAATIAAGGRVGRRGGAARPGRRIVAAGRCGDGRRQQRPRGPRPCPPSARAPPWTGARRPGAASAGRPGAAGRRRRKASSASAVAAALRAAWRPSCRVTPARPAAGEKNAAERVGAEPAVLDGAPAVDLAEHRAEPRVGEVEPAAQRLHRAAGQGRAVRDRHAAQAVPVRPRRVDGEVDRRCGEPDMLGVEADQGGAAKASGGEQQQGAVAHAGEIARAGGGHAPELGRGRRARPVAGGAAASRADERGDRGIRGGTGQAGRAVVVGDRRGAAAERAAAQRCCGGGEERRDRGGCGRERDAAAGLAPGGEAGPVGGVEPDGLGGRRAAGRRARGRAGRVGGGAAAGSPVMHPPALPGPVAPRRAWPRPASGPAAAELRGESAGSGRLRQAWQRRGKQISAISPRPRSPADSVR